MKKYIPILIKIIKPLLTILIALLISGIFFTISIYTTYSLDPICVGWPGETLPYQCNFKEYLEDLNALIFGFLFIPIMFLLSIPSSMEIIIGNIKKAVYQLIPLLATVITIYFINYAFLPHVVSIVLSVLYLLIFTYFKRKNI